MSIQNDVLAWGATRIAVHSSQVIRISPGEFEYHMQIKYVSGGSIEIVQPQFSGSSTASGGTNAWGKGYLLGTTEVYPPVPTGAAAFYVCATGGTGVIQLAIGQTVGATTL